MRSIYSLCFVVVASMSLIGCGGSKSSPQQAPANQCYTTQYNQYGQQAPGCIQPNSAYYNQNQYGYNQQQQYGYNQQQQYGYNQQQQYGYNDNPCMMYYQQYGIMYVPGMVQGQMMCVPTM